MRLEILDSTLRDGAQGEGISFSAQDKLKILERLDAFGIDFVEAGNPGSNPKDLEFFRRASKIKLSRAKLVAFGSTKRKNLSPEEDENLTALLEAKTEYVSIFGKSWDLHAESILGITLDENLSLIEETIKYLVSKGKKVFFDAEHFFDGYKNNPDYALTTLNVAENAGAEVLVLCDTNGGCFPDEISKIVNVVKSRVKSKIGIHCHNDTGCAVANSISAVKSGALHVQGTFIGFGERCGNANLSSLIPSFNLKLNYNCAGLSSETLTDTAQFIAEAANLRLPRNLPYVGGAAFSHKGGMHADGVFKDSRAYEHIDPESVGNERNILLSEVSGRSAIFIKLRKIAPDLDKNDEAVRTLTDKIKDLEHKGYHFEAASASFELLVLKELGRFNEFFEIVDFNIISTASNRAKAMIKVKVNETFEITADEGDGPVNAIDKALRKALERFYPSLKKMKLTDYKVRIINSSDNTAAITRVLIESGMEGELDEDDIIPNWLTVGASDNIINASMLALTDSLEYMLMKTEKG